MQVTEELEGARVDLLGLEHAVRMDVELGAFEQGEPLDFITPAHRAFTDEVTQFVQARIARDAKEESSTRRQGRAPVA